MMEQYALEPCPFCGGAVQKMEVRRSPETPDEIGVAIRCENPGCYAGTVFTYTGLAAIMDAFPDADAEDIKESVKLCAARQWNRRAV